MKLLDVLNVAPVAGEFGIEVEVEGNNVPQLDNKFWVTHRDGSLRGESAEYVTNGPVSGKDVRTAMMYLNDLLQKNGTQLNMSFRTSVHVHMNMLDKELDKILTIVYLYYLFEEPLMKLCGQDRIGNRFCLRLRDCDGIIEVIKQVFKDSGMNIRRINEADIRYAALNLAPLRKFGSIEFRAMRGTVDTETIVKWTEILAKIRDCKFLTAMEAYTFLQEKGVMVLAAEVFGELLPFILFEGFENEVMLNSSLMIEIPHTVKFKEVAKKKTIDDVMKEMDDRCRGQAMPVVNQLFEAAGIRRNIPAAEPRWEIRRHDPVAEANEVDF